MSGQDIIIAQLRADVERLRERAEKAERFIATADSEWKSRAEKAERFVATADSEWKARAELARLRARMPSEVELKAFRFICRKEWPWGVDDYKDAVESWLARQEDSDG